jgi:hypothetical protein
MAHPMLAPPMPAPCVGPDAHAYVVELKAVESRPGQDDSVSFCPKLMLPAGAQTSICFDNEPVLGQCGGGQAPPAPVLWAKGLGHPGRSGGMVRVQVSAEHEGRVELDLDVQQTEIEKTGKEGVQVLSKSLHAVRPVKLGKATRLVLDRCPDGTACRWLEVTVKDGDHPAAACCPAATGCSTQARVEMLPAPKLCVPAGRLPGPKPCEPVACCPAMPCYLHKEKCDSAAMWMALAELVDNLGGFQTYEMGLTLPSSTYLGNPSKNPPQYLPPEPLPCAPACTEPAASAASWVRPVTGTVQQCAANVPAQPSPIHVTVAEDQARLEVCCGGGARIGCKKMDLKMTNTEPMVLAPSDGQVALTGSQVHARANAITTDQKDLLVLEGRVRLQYTKDGQSAEITATRIEVSLSEGTLKIKP